MKLELKHLAPYLPYKLKGASLRGSVFYLDTFSNMLGKGIESREIGTFLKEKYKPILRPLSDLTKFSEDFINEHSINLMLEEKYKLDYGVFSHHKGELDIELDGDSSVMYDQNKSIPSMAVIDIYNELLKGHYDVFGLIKEGLAININTLEQ